MAVEDLRENPFRDEICAALVSKGYVEGHKGDYVIDRALDGARLVEFLERTQGPELAKFRATHGADWQNRLLRLWDETIEHKGLIHTLKGLVEDYASGSQFHAVDFPRNLAGMGEGSVEKNVFSVRREFIYENKAKPRRVDLTLFLNGIPVAMIELKKRTAGQSAGVEGMRQYRSTRDPREKVFGFNRRTLFYLVMDEFEAFVTTQLAGPKTKFLPFNRGSAAGGAGNPIEEGKHPTHHVWDELLEREMLLRVIRDYLFIDEEGKMIFPRYHQLDAVLKLERDVREHGVGGRYLVWHSAGSGKTKTISWLAFRLLNLPEIKTVIVISDRKVIDSQLAGQALTMDAKTGRVQWAEDSAELADLLNEGGVIVVTTLQKFPLVLEKLQEKKGEQYGIIIDEAHSSTAGKTMSKLSETLAGKSLVEAAELEKAYEEREDGQRQLQELKPRITATKNASYFAFTATPQTQTMELFGTRKESGKSCFHQYSMRQAIEEGFILNPIACYTVYSDKLEARKKDGAEGEFESARTTAAILHYLTSTPEVVERKTAIMLSDFLARRQNWLGGTAKAMILTASRKHAVCYKLAVERFLEGRGCDFKAVVGFTGSIVLDDTTYTEENMNAGLEGRDLRQIIQMDPRARIIVVADKLQTGFDEDRLCVMYIDKQLKGRVKAVQTISRLNRARAGKRTFVMDFLNEAVEIKAAFEFYYGGELWLPGENEIDPNVLFQKRDHLLEYGVFTMTEAKRAYEFIVAEEKHAPELSAMFAELIGRHARLPVTPQENKQKLFVAEASKFVSLFYYVSTVFARWDLEMKRLAVFLDALLNVLKAGEDQEPIRPEDLAELVKFTTRKVLHEQNLLPESVAQELDSVPTSTRVAEPKTSPLDEIIERINAKYGYEQAKDAVESIVTTLATDAGLAMNVRNSAKSAYEAETMDRLNAICVNGMLSSEGEQERFYAELSKDKEFLQMLAFEVIRRIQQIPQAV
jgi:type I restriction enzyme R subunit